MTVLIIMKNRKMMVYCKALYIRSLSNFQSLSQVICERTIMKTYWVFEMISLSCFRLDYSGIAFLIMGSFVPWLYYSFYCSPQPCVVYLIVVCILGLAAITVSQCDFFATPQYRGVRAGKQSPSILL